MADTLFLSEKERANLYDKAGNLRGEVSPDLPEYNMGNDAVRVALEEAPGGAGINWSGAEDLYHHKRTRQVK